MKSLVIFMVFISQVMLLKAVPRNLVVVEIGTGTWTSSSVGAALGADDLVTNNQPVAIISNHNGDPYANTFSTSRNSFYGITGYPTARFDGLNQYLGGGSQSLYTTYLPRVNSRMSVESNYSIEATGGHEINNFFITVTIDKHQIDTNANVVLHSIITESNITYNWFGQTQLNHVTRQMLPDQDGTPISLGDGETTTVPISFSWNSSWNQDNAEIVFFLQDTTTKEILQGAKYSLSTFNGEIPIVNDLAAIGIVGPTNITVGETSSYTIAVKNNGINTQSSYQVKLYDNNNIELGAASGVVIQPGQTNNYSFNWIPAVDGLIGLYGRIFLSGDQFQINDQTSALSVTVQLPGISAVTIGVGTEQARVPMDFYSKNSLYECLYYPSELGFVSGTIHALQFYNSFVTANPAGATKIWLGSTAQTDLSEGWIPSTQLTLVFDGNMAYPSGVNTINFELTTPYTHTTGNLVMMVNRPMDTQYYNPSNNFLAQTIGTTRARKVQSDTTTYDPANPPASSTNSGQFPKTTIIYIGQALTNDLGCLDISGNLTPNVGAPTSYVITVKNNGSAVQNNYMVKLMKEGNVEVGSVTGTTIHSQQSLQFSIPWTPIATGATYIYGKVELIGDENANNNLTQNHHVVVQDQSIVAVTVGAGGSTGRMPVDMYYKNSLFETVYLSTELNIGGLLTGIQFYNSFTTNLPNMPTNIWVGETTQTDLAAGWIPSTQLTQVFSGNVNFPSGTNNILITLTTPFPYGGGNLVVMVQRPMDTQYFSSSDVFVTQTGTIASRTRNAYSDSTPFDPANPPTTTPTGMFPKTTLMFTANATSLLMGTVLSCGNPLSGADIYATNSFIRQTLTNEQGHYSLPYMVPGTCDVTVSKHGYLSATQTIYLLADQTNILDFELEWIFSPFVSQPMLPLSVEMNNSVISDPINTIFSSNAPSLYYDVSSTANLCTVLNVDHTVSITPVANWYGVEFITIRATDPLGQYVDFSLKVTVLQTSTFIETFDHDGSLPAGWTYGHNGTTSFLWQAYQESGADYAVRTTAATGSTVNERLLSSAYDLSNLRDVRISFDCNFLPYGSGSGILAYTLNNITFTMINTYTSAVNGQINYSLPALDGKPSVRFRWIYINSQTNLGEANHWILDNFKILGVVRDNLAPVAVNGLCLISGTDNSATLGWEPGSDLYFDQYQLYISTDSVVDLNDQLWSVEQDYGLYYSATAHTTVMGLSNTTYWAAIRALDQSGNASILSDVISFYPESVPPVFTVPIPSPQPDPVWAVSRTTSIGATIFDDNQIAPNSLQYRIHRNADGTYDPALEPWQSIPPEAVIRSQRQLLSFSLELMLDADGIFPFEFKAADVSGNVGYSGFQGLEGISDDWVLRIDTLPPAPIDQFFVASVASHEITVAWSATTDLSFAGYRIVYSLDNVIDGNDPVWDSADDPDLAQPGSGSISTTITGLSAATSYHLWLEAVDEAGHTTAHPTLLTAVTSYSAPPSVPLNLSLVISGDDVMLSWDSVNTDSLGVPINISGYKLYVGDHPSFECDANSWITDLTDTYILLEDVALFADRLFFKVTASTGTRITWDVAERIKLNPAFIRQGHRNR